MIAPGGIPEVASLDERDAERMVETFSATDVHMRDADGLTMRHFAATEGQHREFVALSVDGVTVTHRQWQNHRMTLEVTADHRADATCFLSVEQARQIRDQLSEILAALDADATGSPESLHDHATRRAG